MDLSRSRPQTPHLARSVAAQAVVSAIETNGVEGTDSWTERPVVRYRTDRGVEFERSVALPLVEAL